MDYARLIGAGVIIGTNFILYAGPLISTSLGVANATGQFDSFYNGFENVHYRNAFFNMMISVGKSASGPFKYLVMRIYSYLFHGFYVIIQKTDLNIMKHISSWSYVIILFIPTMTLNYFLFLHHNRYKDIIKKYFSNEVSTWRHWVYSGR